MSKRSQDRQGADELPSIPGYEFLNLIGSGGQGSVYRARQLSLDRIVAVKILSADADEGPKLVKRFLREARLASQLHHSNVLQAIDVGKHNGQLFFVMEYVAGPDAATLLAESGPMREPQVLDLAYQLASALQYTAQCGIFHGDIKPENLVIAHDGTVKIVDFGIAGLLRRSKRSASGTNGFIAPEVLANGEVDARSDLYSLGVTLFEMLTGKMPESGRGLRQLQPEVSPELEAIVERLIEPKPSKRFRDGAALAEAIVAVRAASSGTNFSTQQVPRLPQGSGHSNSAGTSLHNQNVPRSGRLRRAGRSRHSGQLFLPVTLFVLAAIGWYLYPIVMEEHSSRLEENEPSNSVAEHGREDSTLETSRRPLATALRLIAPSDGAISHSGTILVEGSFDPSHPATLTLNDESLAVSENRFERTLSGLADGQHTLILRARDEQGRSHEQKVEFLVDTTPPKLEVVLVNNDSWVARNHTLTGTVEDASPVRLAVGGVAAKVSPRGHWEAQLKLDPGENTIDIVAVDAGDFRTERSVILRVDASKPELTLEVESQRTNRSEIVLRATVADQGKIIKVSIGGQTATQEGEVWVASVPLANEGDNTIVAVAQDSAGNEATVSLIVERDSTPPQVQVTSSNGEVSRGSRLQVAGTVDDVKALVMVGGHRAEVSADGSWSVEVPVEESPCSLEIMAKDDLSNQSKPEYLGLNPPTEMAILRRRGHKRSSRSAQDAVDAALDWLARHQSQDGSWDCDGFMSKGNADLGPLCDRGGGAQYDVGVTGLALLTFLGAGETHNAGKYQSNVAKGLNWLIGQQAEDGCFGLKSVNNFGYSHAIGALAMVEAYGMTKSPLFKDAARKGIDYVLLCQNPNKAWRYKEAEGHNDTSVTGWMLSALKAAKDADLKVEDHRFGWALDWIDEMTDPENGRTGYNIRGSHPVRESGDLEKFVPSESESLTAIGILIRIYCGAKPKKDPLVKLGVDLLAKKHPVWDLPEGKTDMYYWFYGSQAMFQVGGNAWRQWERDLLKAVIGKQREDGNFAGSWDPEGAWGRAGGRVYSTAILALSLQAEYRHPRIFR